MSDIYNDVSTIYNKYVGRPYEARYFELLRSDLKSYFTSSVITRPSFTAPVGEANGRLFFPTLDLFKKLCPIMHAFLFCLDVPDGLYDVYVNSYDLTEYTVEYEHLYGIETVLKLHNSLTGEALDMRMGNCQI